MSGPQTFSDRTRRFPLYLRRTNRRVDRLHYICARGGGGCERTRRGVQISQSSNMVLACGPYGTSDVDTHPFHLAAANHNLRGIGSA